MKTFRAHPSLDGYRGLAIAVQTHDRTVFVGRCQHADHREIVLLDADLHELADDSISRRHYLHHAATFGVSPRYGQLTIPSSRVVSITPLNQIT